MISSRRGAGDRFNTGPNQTGRAEVNGNYLSFPARIRGRPVPYRADTRLPTPDVRSGPLPHRQTRGWLLLAVILTFVDLIFTGHDRGHHEPCRQQGDTGCQCICPRKDHLIKSID